MRSHRSATKDWIVRHATKLSTGIAVLLLLVGYYARDEVSAVVVLCIGLSWMGVTAYLVAILHVLRLRMEPRIIALDSLFRALASKKREYLEQDITAMERGTFVQNAAAPQGQLLDTFALITDSVHRSFVTVSIAHFWSTGNMGGDNLEPYLHKNQEIVRRGGTVERYVVLEQSELDNSVMPGPIRRALARLRDVEEEMDQSAPSRLRSYVLTLEELPATWNPIRNFAIWNDRKGEQWLVDMEHIVRWDSVVVFGSIVVSKDMSRIEQRELELRDCRSRVGLSLDSFRISKRAPFLRRKRQERLEEEFFSVQHDGDGVCTARLLDLDHKGGLGCKTLETPRFKANSIVSIPEREGARRYRVCYVQPQNPATRFGLELLPQA